jgi:hypothetical protein
MATKGPLREWLTILSSAMLAVPSLLLLLLCLLEWLSMVFGRWDPSTMSGFVVCGTFAVVPLASCTNDQMV